jgi:transcriptional regulator with XRE-family HTH domain
MLAARQRLLMFNGLRVRTAVTSGARAKITVSRQRAANRRAGIVFGEKLRDLRKSRNMTQVELGVALGGLSQAVISTWEQRESPPENRIIAILADYFGVSIHYFTLTDVIVPQLTTAISHIRALRDRKPSAQTIAISDVISSELNEEDVF